MKILLTGYYGQHNTGDDALAATVAWGLHKVFSPKQIFIASSPLVMPNDLPVSFLPRRLFKGHLALARALQFVRSDLWCFGGGSVFHDIFGISLLKSFRDLIRNYKRLRRGQVIALGVSLGPVRHSSALNMLSEILELLDFVAVRDLASMELAVSLGSARQCVLGFDPAVLLPYIGLPPIPPPLKKDEGIIVSVAPCEYHKVIADGLEHLDNRRNEALAKALGLLSSVDKDLRFKIIEFNGHKEIGDGRIVHALARSLPLQRVSIIPYSPNPLWAFEHVQRSNCVIATRLHAAIFAFTAGVPFVLLCYHPKVREFARYIGMSDQFIIDEDSIEPELIMTVVLSILENPAAALPKMSPQLAKQRALNMFMKAAELQALKLLR